MLVTRNLLAPLKETLTIVIEPQDYLPEIDNEVKIIKKEVAIPGFRKGHVPDTVIKQRYKDHLKSKAVEKILSNTIKDHLKDDERFLLEQPKSVGEPVSNAHNNTLTFVMELLFTSNITINYNHSYNKYSYEVTNESVEDIITKYRRQYQTYEQLDKVEPDSVVYLNLQQQNSKNEILEAGLTANNVLILLDKVSETARQALANKAVNESFVIQLKELFVSEKELNFVFDNKEGEATKNLSEPFLCTVASVEKHNLAELNQEFYSKLFPEQTEINSVEQLSETLKKHIEEEINTASNDLLYATILQSVITNTQVSYPENYIEEKFDKYKAQNKNTTLTLDRFKGLYAKPFVEQLLLEKYNIETQYQELYEFAENHLRKLFYNQVSNDLVMHLLHDEPSRKAIYSKLLEEKLLKIWSDELSIHKQNVTEAEFKEHLAAINS